MFFGIPKEYGGVDLTKLKPQQLRYCEIYAKTGNGFEAARQVGYTEKYSSDLNKRADIQAYISFLFSDDRNRDIADKDELLKRATDVIRGTLEEEVVTSNGNKVKKGVSHRDKIKALELLMKTKGMLTDKKEIKGLQSFTIGLVNEMIDEE